MVGDDPGGKEAVAELTKEQQKALAIANARLRAQQAEAEAPQLSPEMAAKRQEWQSATTPGERFGVMVSGAGAKAVDMLTTMGLRGAPAALGQVLGQRQFGKPGAVVGGAIGGAVGSAADQARLMAQGKQENFSMGQLAGDTLSGAITKRGVAANTLGNVAAANVESLVDKGEMADMGRNMMAASTAAVSAPLSVAMTGSKIPAEQIRRSKEDQTYRMAMDRGYVLDPSLSNPKSKANTALVQIAGQPQLQKDLVRTNQQVTNNIAREELGIPFMVGGENLPIDDGLLLYNRWQVSEPYRQIAQLSPDAPNVLKDLGKKRFQAKTLWRKYNQDGDQKYADMASEADEAAEKLESRLEEIAVKAKAEELLPQMREARRILAKNHVVDSAYNKGTGDVSAKVIGRIYDRGAIKLTDGLEVVGRLENAMPQVMRDVAGTQSPGGGHLRTWMTGAAGAYGYSQGGVPGAMMAAGAAAYGDVPLRKFLQTEQYQRLAAVPRYNMQPNAEEFADALARLSLQTAGRRQDTQQSPNLLRYMTNPVLFAPSTVQ